MSQKNFGKKLEWILDLVTVFWPLVAEFTFSFQI